jgi:predicted RNase H-like HicB family nuclease
MQAPGMTGEIRNQWDSLPRYTLAMNFAIEFEQEEDGRWIAEISSLPGVMAYGASKTEAESKVEAMALRVIADRIERAA